MGAGLLRVAVAPVPGTAGDDLAPTWLCESERQRWPQLGAAARPAFVASRALLRELLQACLRVPFDAWHVSAEAGCAPRAGAPGVPDGAVHVSLSHRLGWVAVALADTSVGIDLECERPARSDPDERAALVLAPAELAEWHAVPVEAQERALLTRWTAKEAWYKASPPQAAPWDFRRVCARACPPGSELANVRTWRAGPLHLALCCADVHALTRAHCSGLPALDGESSWQLATVGQH